MSYNPPYWLDRTQSSIKVSYFGGEFPSSRVSGLEEFINDIINENPNIGFSGSYDDLTDVPTEFAPSPHTHSEYLSAVNPSTDNNIVRFNGAEGQIQDSGVSIDDDGNVEGNNFIHTGADPGQGGTGGSIVSNLLLESISNQLKLTLSQTGGVDVFSNLLTLPDGFSGDYNDLSNVPSTFPPSPHVHSYNDLTSVPSTFPPEAHTHPYIPIVNPSTDNSIVRFNGVNGLVQDSGVEVDDDNNVIGNNFIHTGADPGQGGTGGSVVSSLLLEDISNQLKLTLVQTGGVDIFSNLLPLPEGFSGDYDDLTNQPDLSDLHNHTNKAVLDQFGENGNGDPTYNGTKIDTTIAMRDVYDGLDSLDNTISLSANNGKVLNDKFANYSLNTHVHDGRYFTETESNSRFAYKAGTLGQAFSAGAMTLNGVLTGTSATFSNGVTASHDSAYGQLSVNRTSGGSTAYVMFKLDDSTKGSLAHWSDRLEVRNASNQVTAQFNTNRTTALYGALSGTSATFSESGAFGGAIESGYALKVNGDQKNTGDVYANNFIHTGP